MIAANAVGMAGMDDGFDSLLVDTGEMMGTVEG